MHILHILFPQKAMDKSKITLHMNIDFLSN